MIDLTNIKKTYSNAKDNAYTALKQISLSIDKKKFTFCKKIKYRKDRKYTKTQTEETDKLPEA